ncbi:MAG: selenide, water dikinase SelD [Prochlorotrichaceae cyanobacterium]
MGRKESIFNGLPTDLVLIGGGHSHAIFLRMWGMKPLPGVRLTLISDRSSAPYSGMLPGHVAGFYNFEECHIDLRQLAQFAGAQFYLDRAIGLDLSHQRIACEAHPPVAYDWLSVDIGSTPEQASVPGSAYGIPAKPVPLFLQAWNALLKEVEANPHYPWRFAVVGGGAGGVELLLGMRSRLRQLYAELGVVTDLNSETQDLPIAFDLLHRGDTLMTGQAPGIQRNFAQFLCQRQVGVHLRETVTQVQRSGLSSRLQVSCESGLSLECDRLFWTTQATAPDWIGASGLATDDRGFILVGSTLQSCSHPQVFAVGDIATLPDHPRPKAGVFAVRQGKPLYENICRVLQGKPPRAFIPQEQILALIGDGEGRAAASRGRWSLPFSVWLWWWKEHIDRRFMERFQSLPAMTETNRISPLADGFRPGRFAAGETSSTGANSMYCAGCGSKVAAAVLSKTLQRLTIASAAEAKEGILWGLAAGEDAAVIQSRSDQVLVQTVDFFRALVSDPFLAGQITTEHCLNDLYAMGAEPHSALAIVTLAHGSPSQQEESLYQLLSGVMDRLGCVQATLVGGHTTEGDELALGLTCNGWAIPRQLWQKSTVKPGQVLILTKALGTGTLFVAQQQGKGKAAWIDEAIDSMLWSNYNAVKVLQDHGTTACTDITGFGLLGHLLEMLRRPSVRVHLQLDALPILAGAIETLRQGCFSSLHPQNQTYLHSPTASQMTIACSPTDFRDPSTHPHWPILFDPQTSGGLLAALPHDRAEHCLRVLQTAGYYHSAIIGTIVGVESI